ncbi:cysteine--tRNA ligase [Planctomycetota bacterium]
MALQFYNTLTRQKEDFRSLEEGKVGIYVCGPTVYGHSHLGHAKSYVSFDVLVRYLRYLGYSVTYVQNITDVGHLTDDADEGDDKLAVVAQKEKKHPMAIAEYYTHSYFEDMDKLNILRPDISPRATGHITEQIELTQTLIDKGFAYEANGSVYFNVAAFKEYGKLSGRNIEDMVSGTRIESSSDKRNATDFALWKKAETNHVMQWPSPWGMGYPGWHLECSVMSMKYLGKTIDIHGGGLENQFPHHECEIAQSEAANEAPFVRTWLHNNMITVDGQKMGKSLNNFILLKQAFTGDHERLTQAYDPMAIRQFILSSHYRSPLDFSDQALSAAQSGYERIRDAVINLRQAQSQAPAGDVDTDIAAQLADQKQRFETAMNDDLNTSVALSVLFDMVKTANKVLASEANQDTLAALEVQFNRLGGDALGIVKETYEQADSGGGDLVGQLMELLLEQRAAARKNKDFATSDLLRDKITAIGIVLKDTPQGTEWSLT